MVLPKKLACEPHTTILQLNLSSKARFLYVINIQFNNIRHTCHLINHFKYAINEIGGQEISEDTYMLGKNLFTEKFVIND